MFAYISKFSYICAECCSSDLGLTGRRATRSLVPPAHLTSLPYTVHIIAFYKGNVFHKHSSKNIARRLLTCEHRVDRVQGFFLHSSELGPPPHPQASVPPTFGLGGRETIRGGQNDEFRPLTYTLGVGGRGAWGAGTNM